MVKTQHSRLYFPSGVLLLEDNFHIFMGVDDTNISRIIVAKSVVDQLLFDHMKNMGAQKPIKI